MSPWTLYWLSFVSLSVFSGWIDCEGNAVFKLKSKFSCRAINKNSKNIGQKERIVGRIWLRITNLASCRDMNALMCFLSGWTGITKVLALQAFWLGMSVRKLTRYAVYLTVVFLWTVTDNTQPITMCGQTHNRTPKMG